MKHGGTWNGSSNYGQLLNITRLIFLSFLIVFCVPIIGCASDPPVLTLSSNGWRGSDGYDPTYTFEIYENGLVHYHGEIKVKVIGDRTAKITPQQVQQLIATYKAIDNLFKQMEAQDKERYERSKPRHSSEFFRLHYHGETLELRPAGFSRDMFVNLNKITPIKSWICFDENDPLYIGCPVEAKSRPNLYPID